MESRRNKTSQLMLGSKWTNWALLASLFFAVTLARSWASIKFLPPDPGLGFQLSARTDGLPQLFNSYNGYLQVLPRFISEFLNLVPLSQLTYWSTFSNALISMACAAAITRALRELIEMKSAILVGLVLSTAFSAHEGLVGNLWGIRWTMLPATCVIASIPSYSQKYWRSTLFLFIATGLSHAYIFIPAAIYVLDALTRRDFRRRTLLLGSILVTSTLFQGIGYLNSLQKLQLYGNSTIYWPWKGSGVFWWAVFTLPLLFALIAIVPNLNFRKSVFRNLTPQFLIATQAVLISTISYLQLGIKSSPAVATITLSFAAVVVGSNKKESWQIRLRIYSLLKVLCLVVITILSIRYYLPSYFLTNGEGWSKEVETSLNQCQRSDLTSTKLVYFRMNDVVLSESLPCGDLASWDKWFFQR